MCMRFILALMLLSPFSAQTAQTAETVGAVEEEQASTPIKVRHGSAREGEAIVTLRYFRIEKGRFPEFLEASQTGVWPFFEKIGARVVGMWQQFHPTGVDAGTASEDYDEVWLMTRYASLEHWENTRRMAELGGNGPDYQKAMEALRQRRELTLETNLRFLQGSTWHNPPQYLPPVD